MYNTIDEIFAKYSEVIDLEEGHPVRGLIQYKFTDAPVSNWYLEINGVDLIAHKGNATDPVSTVEILVGDYLALKNKLTTWGKLINANKVILSGDKINLLKLNDYMRK